MAGPLSAHMYKDLELGDVGSLELAVLAGRDVELDSLALVQGLEAVHLNLGVVDEQVVAVLTRDEAVALVRVEPLNSTLCHVVPFVLSPAGPNAALARDTVALSHKGYSTPKTPCPCRETRIAGFVPLTESDPRASGHYSVFFS